MSDKELILLCLQGNSNGYTLLYNKYAKSIFHSIHRLVSDVAEAEDLLQETFVTVFSNKERLKELDSFEAWTRRIAINTSISVLRKRKMYFSDIDTVSETEIVQLHNDEKEWETDRIEEMQQIIESLPDMTRTIVNLYLFEDMSQEEISKTLGMSHTAVRSQYHRAKTKIMQGMKERMQHGG